MPLTKAGRYQITGELGHGAMGIVYRGFDPTIGRTVAIKTVLLDTGDPDLLKRFRREAQAAGILSHPNIVTIYDAGEDNGVFYIAMELVEGETLQQILARGALPLKQAVAIGEQVGAALDHAHARNIIHRDIKPANIMVSEGHAKVMDFGVAKMTGVGMTSTGQVLGTPSYMSPELVKGASADGRSDIFSLGVVLYEVLTGAKPFTGDNITTVIYKIIGEQPEPPATLNPDLPEGLNYVVLKALAKDPAERYQDCAELSSDLRNYQGLAEKGKHAARMVAAAAASAPREVSGTVTVDRKALGLNAAPAAASAAPARRKPRLALVGVVLAALAGAGLLWQMRHGPEPGAGSTPERIVMPAPASRPAGSQPPPPAKPPSPAPSLKKAATAAPEPAGPAMFDFQVSATANPAAIYIDGRTKPEWKTPYRFKLPADRHSVEARKDGYRTEQKQVEIGRGGPRSLVLELAPLTASIEIVTRPGGAEVLVDGQRQPSTTPARFSLPYGEHRVGVRKQGFRPLERVVQVNEGTPAKVELELVPEKMQAAEVPAPAGRGADGRVVVLTEPQGATIFVNDRRTDFRSPVNFALPPGRYKITIEARNYQTETHDVVVRRNQTTPINAKLKPTGEKRRRFPLFR